MIPAHVNNLSDEFIPPIGSQDNEPADIDLNEIVQKICTRYTSDGKNFILRADKLPHVNCSQEVFTHLFGELVSMIVNHPPQNSKLFLYITCKEQSQDAEVMDLQLGGETMYVIDFHTNITSDKQWTNLYKSKLDECSVLIQQNGGDFTFFPICNTGCLFSISLPGKIK